LTYLLLRGCGKRNDHAHVVLKEEGDVVGHRRGGLGEGWWQRDGRRGKRDGRRLHLLGGEGGFRYRHNWRSGRGKRFLLEVLRRSGSHEDTKLQS
jgi:hypothetical protein